MAVDDISRYAIMMNHSMPAEGTVAGSLPLTETTFYILLSLAPGASHGYAIMKDVERLSQGRLVLSTGTLYGALKRLLEAGWIERATEDGRAAAAHAGTRQRKAYALTHLGRRGLEAETARMEALVTTARVRTTEANP